MQNKNKNVEFKHKLGWATSQNIFVSRKIYKKDIFIMTSVSLSLSAMFPMPMVTKSLNFFIYSVKTAHISFLPKNFCLTVEN